jgi:TonB family protein
MARSETLQDSPAWYLFAGSGMVRVRPGMRLGETLGGELTLGAIQAQIELNVNEDGSLLLRAIGNVELESADGRRGSSARLSRHRRGVLRLPNNLIHIDPEFLRAEQASAVLVAVLPRRAAAKPRNPDPRRVAAFADALVEATTKAARAVPVRAPVHTKGGHDAPMHAASGAQPEPDAQEHDPTPEPGPSAEQAFDRAIGSYLERPRRRRSPFPLVTAVILLTGTVLVLLDPTLLDRVKRLSETPSPHPDSLASASASASASAQAQLSVPLSAEDAEATEVIEPTETLDPLEGELEPPAEPSAAPASAEPSSAPILVAASRIEPIVLPAVERRLPPPVAPPVAETAPTPAAEVRRRVDPSVAAELDSAVARLRELAAATSLRRDLVAANLALTQGRLVLPAEDSAYVLYTRVLAQDPQSPAAIRGLQSIRQELVNRTLALLASDALDDARRSLETATEVGVDRQLVTDLHFEIDYRQRLIDARAGRFETLYPLDDLVAIDKEPPRLPPLRNAAGPVDVEFTVSTSGAVTDVVVLGSPRENVKRAVLKSVADWRFVPVLADGRPVPVRSSVRFVFQ